MLHGDLVQDYVSGLKKCKHICELFIIIDVSKLFIINTGMYKI